MHSFEVKQPLIDYLNSQAAVQTYLGLKEAKIDQVQQLGPETYKLVFGNSNNKIVLHVKPTDTSKAGNQLEKDYTITQKLAAANFPVVKPLFYCADLSIIGANFYATEYVEGRVFNDQKLIGVSAAEKTILFQEVAKALARLHSISLSHLGLGELQAETNQYETLNKKLYNVYKLHETKISTNVEDLLYWLPLNSPVKSNSDNLCLVHGDISISKVIFHPFEPRILAIVDWQTATLGNALTDLANYISPYYVPFSNGQHKVDGWFQVESMIEIPEMETIIKAYFQTRSVSIIPDIKYQIALALLKQAIDQQILFKQTKDVKFQQNSEFLSKAGYQIVLDITNGDPFEIKIRAMNDCALWSGWTVTDRCKSYYYRVKDFLRDELFPAEKKLLDIARGIPKTTHNKGVPEIEALQQKAKALGLWNLFISDPIYGKGLTNLEYVFISELMGLSFLAHEIFNCFAPETGNIKLLIGYGSPYQKEKYLKPLMEGECKSFFAMTEKNVSSSDPNNFQFTITPTEAGYILNGEKYFASSTPDERAIWGIVMGKSAKDMSNPIESQSMIIVDMDNPNIRIIRQIRTIEYFDIPHGYAEVEFKNVFVPKENLLGELGGAFRMAQGRLLGGRLHHCVREIGLTRRSLDLVLSRAEKRVIDQEKLIDNAAFLEKLGELEIAFQSCRQLSLIGGLLLDSVGSKHLHTFMVISQCKAHIPKACQDIVDACIQRFGAEGLTEEQPLTMAFRVGRAIRFMDGPCEVHLRQIARFAYGNHMFNDLNNAEGYGLAKL